jgi:hypothetical protein
LAGFGAERGDLPVQDLSDVENRTVYELRVPEPLEGVSQLGRRILY